MKIEGVKLDVPGGELRDLFLKGQKKALAKADQAAAKAAVLEKAGEEYREVDGLSNSGSRGRIHELREQKSFLESTARRFEFLADHVDTAAVYVIDAGEFRQFGHTGFGMGAREIDIDLFED